MLLECAASWEAKAECQMGKGKRRKKKMATTTKEKATSSRPRALVVDDAGDDDCIAALLGFLFRLPLVHSSIRARCCSLLRQSGTRGTRVTRPFLCPLCREKARVEKKKKNEILKHVGCLHRKTSFFFRRLKKKELNSI